MNYLVVILFSVILIKVGKGAKIRYRYNQAPHLTKDNNGKVTNSQLFTTNEGQEVSPLAAGDHKAHINRRIQMHSKHMTVKNMKESLFVIIELPILLSCKISYSISLTIKLSKIKFMTIEYISYYYSYR